jgi:hypothetical protein
VNGKCRLCGNDGILLYSHLIPRFAVKWLKKTSATGYLRSLLSGKRHQETRREYLLCPSCERLLGRDEKRFSERIFVPYQQKPHLQTSFVYEEWFLRFLVGLHWRALVTMDAVPENVSAVFDAAEERWRKYLLGQAPDPGTTEFHVQFADVIDHSTFDLPKKINWYLARSFDASPMHTPSGEALTYVKLPRFIFLAFITPRDPKDEDWNGTQVSAQGVIHTKQNISTTRVGEFLLGRARAIDDAPPSLTARQKRKMLEQAQVDPRPFLESDSFQVHLADRRMRAIEEARAVRIEVKGRDRNKPCPCGSGRKAKKCHARL